MDSETFVKRSPQEEVRRGNDAARILDDPIFQESIKAIEDGLKEKRRQVPLSAVDIHTKLIMTEQLLAGLLDSLKNTLITGKFAMRQLDEEKSRLQRMAQVLQFRS